MLFMTGVSVVYQTLYDSGDLKFLLSTPTPAGSVVAAKLTVALVRNLAAILPFMYPVWVGYGAGSGSPASFYFMSLLAILLATLLFTAVVAIFVMLVNEECSDAKDEADHHDWLACSCLHIRRRVSSV